MNGKNINLVCLPNGSSYGRVSTNILRELFKRKYWIALFPTLQDHRAMEIDQKDMDMVNSALSNALNFDYLAPSVKIWHHDWNHNLFPGKGKKCHWTIFELDQLSPQGINSLRGVDQIIVCSEWAKKVIQHNDIGIPVSVVPLGVDVMGRKKKPPDDYITRFVHCGKWEVRKSSMEVVKAFEKAFTPDDDVELHFITGNRLIQDNVRDNWENQIQSGPMEDKIFVTRWLPREEQVYDALSYYDCGVFLNKAEGFNLPLLECMAVGLPVIAMNYSAPMEYLNEENAMLIPPGPLEVAYDGYWFKSGIGKWASVREEQIQMCADYMQLIYNRKRRGENLFNAVGFETGQKFSWDNSCEKLLEAIA